MIMYDIKLRKKQTWQYQKGNCLHYNIFRFDGYLYEYQNVSPHYKKRNEMTSPDQKLDII
jgi:hypothetical protein